MKAKGYYIMNFIIGKKELFDGKNDVKQGFILNTVSYPVLVKTNVAGQPSLMDSTKAFEAKVFEKWHNPDEYIAIPCNDGERVSATEAKWWESRTPNLVIEVIKEIKTVAKPKAVKK